MLNNPYLIKHILEFINNKKHLRLINPMFDQIIYKQLSIKKQLLSILTKFKDTYTSGLCMDCKIFVLESDQCNNCDKFICKECNASKCSSCNKSACWDCYSENINYCIFCYKEVCSKCLTISPYICNKCY